jgi:glycosyltransferase involved in cell wall biosynthesis
MKLCWLLPSDKSGGITPVSLSCCRQAINAGHQATMLLLKKPTWISSDGFQVASLGLDAGVAETPKILGQWLKDNPQDVVFFNSCDEFDIIIPYLPSYIKCVYVVHDTALPYWSKALTEEDNLEAIIAVSETVAGKFRHRLKHPEKLSVIYNGCVFPEAPNANIVRQDNLVFLGGDNPTKGAFDVLKLWTVLIKIGFSGKLQWFGNLMPEFIKKIKKLPNSNRIEIFGHVSRDKVFSNASTAKVLLMLSRVEPFGMATIEAMAMGCVPVAWDVETGTKEITTANKTGLFAPLSDMQALAKQVIYACENYQNFNTAVIQQARSNFNETVMWQGYQTLIDDVATLKPISRSRHHQEPVSFQKPVRRFQLLPSGIRSLIRELIGRSPTLGYWLRDMRGR